MSRFEPYLIFDGNCADAMQFYERVFAGKLAMMTQADSPMANQAPPGSADRILHARLEFDGHILTASDSMVGQPYAGMHNVFLSLTCLPSDAQRLFDVLAEGGTVIMPLGKTFWAEAFGMLIDRFGTSWMISGEEDNESH